MKYILKIIAEEKLKQTGNLDLSSNDLDEIPEEVLELKHLQSLNLSENRISDYSFLGKLTNLRSLDLNNNQISDISFLEKLTRLRELWLYDNKINNIESILTMLSLKNKNMFIVF